MIARTFAITASALIAAVGIGITPSQAQGPLYDKVDVNLPYTITLGDATLQPGNYTIKELPSQNKERVLLIYSEDGVKHEATVMTIPAYDNRLPDDTKVVLHHYGPDYYFDKIWIAGKNYGYEFPVPANVKERQREREGPVSVAASYQPAPSETTTAAAAPPPATPEPAPEPQAAPPAQPAPPPANEPTAQNTPPPQPETQPENTANREAPVNNTQNNTKKLPATSADWLTMLLTGGGLSGIGLALRRKR